MLDLIALQTLVKDITEQKKRDDFLQLSGTLKPADELLLLMQEQVDALAHNSDTLQHLFIWVYQKSICTNACYKPIAIRTFYVALIRVLYFTLNRALNPTLAINNARSRQFIKHFERAYSLANNPDNIIVLNTGMGENPVRVIASVLVLDLEPQLGQFLQQLHAQLVPMIENVQQFQDWRQAYGQNYIDNFRSIIGFHIEFSEPDKELLKRYYTAYDLLLSCLNSASCEVTDSVKEKIEKASLLPKRDGFTKSDGRVG
jgi:hypothetical protein